MVVSDLDGYRLSRSSSRVSPDARCAAPVGLLCDKYGLYGDRSANDSGPRGMSTNCRARSGRSPHLQHQRRPSSNHTSNRYGRYRWQIMQTEPGAKLAALHAATDAACANLAAGRYIEIDEGQLDHYLAELGDASNSTPHVPTGESRSGGSRWVPLGSSR